MKLFRTYTFTWWQVSLFKIYLFSLGILAGLYLRDFLKEGVSIIIFVAVVLSFYFIYSVFSQKI
jgi:hypothetical protein